MSEYARNSNKSELLVVTVCLLVVIAFPPIGRSDRFFCNLIVFLSS
jgi:hypothetical protein